MSVGFVIVLRPSVLANPDTDLRIVVPDSIEAVSGGAVAAEGWGYAPNGDMHLFFSSQSEASGFAGIQQALSHSLHKGNDLSTATIACRVSQSGPYTVVAPIAAAGEVVEDIDA